TGTLGGTLTGTISAGTSTLTISGVTYTKAESGVILTATRTSGDSLSSGNSAPFTVVAGAVTDVAVVLLPTSLTADGSSQSTATATVTDSNGNLRTGDTVTFTTNGDVTIGSTTNNGDGTYSATITASITADSETITGHDGAVTGTATLTEIAG